MTGNNENNKHFPYDVFVPLSNRINDETVQNSALTSGLIKKLNIHKTNYAESLKNLNKKVDHITSLLSQNPSNMQEKLDQTVMNLKSGISEIIERNEKITKNLNNKLENYAKGQQELKENLEKQQDLLTNMFTALNKQMIEPDGKKDSLLREVNGLKDTIHANNSEQQHLLNTIYYSTKKMSKSIGKEKDDATKSEIQFLSALEVLYEHIRRLESDKDELGIELLRIGGDSHQKEKLASIEKELENQKALSEKYLLEKKEIEGKMVEMESLWEKNKKVNE